MDNSSQIHYFQNAMAFIEVVKRINNFTELSSIFLKFIKPMGFNQFSCASFCDVKNPPENAIMILQYPIEWLDYYIDQKYERFDRILTLSLNRLTPFSWADPIVKKNSTKKQLEIFDGANQVGLLHGITVPVHANGFHPACVNLVGDNLDTDPEASHALHLMCIYLYEAAVRIQKSSKKFNNFEITALTNRERECLQWASEGKSNTSIAEFLKISPNTVHFHIENVKKKYGVATRTQAVVRAFSEHQIVPQ